VPASAFSIDVQATPLGLIAVPPVLPSLLLQRRPDIAAAERRVAAANAEIGVARAAFFPSISLMAEGGFQNTGLPSLFTAPNILWSLGPSAMLTLFDGGARRAQVDVARSAWIQASAQYREQTLKAFQEVEDDLGQLHHLHDEALAENRAVIQAGQVEKLSLNRYVLGAVSYLDVVSAQATALRVRRNAIDLNTRLLQADVRLIQAIGGSWTPGKTGDIQVSDPTPVATGQNAHA
jgi:NodT family efflux transporter outer membrane factor (OMF) lipoprotein